MTLDLDLKRYFKSKEWILNECKKIKNIDPKILVDEVFDTFKTRMEVFEGYMFNRLAFYRDYPKYHEDFMSLYSHALNTSESEDLQRMWIHWLYSYCFGDIE